MKKLMIIVMAIAATTRFSEIIKNYKTGFYGEIPNRYSYGGYLEGFYSDSWIEMDFNFDENTCTIDIELD